jgi:hypothetical protein
MAQLSKVKNNKPMPIGVDGVFIHNLPAKQVLDIFGDMNERLAKEPHKVVLELFTKLICDENGDAFEDVGSYEAILEVLSLKDIQEIMTGIAETMNPSGKDLGK